MEKKEHGALEMRLSVLKPITKLGKGNSFFNVCHFFKILGLQISHLIIQRGNIQRKESWVCLAVQTAALLGACAQHLLRCVFPVSSLLCIHAVANRFSNALRSLRRKRW